MASEHLPATSPSEDAIEHAVESSGRPHSIRNGLLALTVALPWPFLLAFFGANGLLLWREPDAFLLLTGGMSMMVLFPLLKSVPQGDFIAGILIPVIWLAVVLLPPCLFCRRLGIKLLFGLLLGISFFSFLQAIIGLVVLKGGDV